MPNLNFNCSKKKKVRRFLHTGPKKGVEKEYEVHFAEIQDNKIRHLLKKM